MSAPAGVVVRIPSGDVAVSGDLAVPDRPRGLVVFAHGSGSSRLSGRNRRVARILQESGLATLLIDLLTEHEEAVDVLTREHRFDIPLLARRLTDAIDWAAEESSTPVLPLGLFGASTGAAAALVAAARRPGAVHALVSRRGRPDLADPDLPSVAAPTLLIVGSDDRQVVALNRVALTRLGVPGELRLVPGAIHLFEEPGALDEVAELARDWFLRHLVIAAPSPPGAGGGRRGAPASSVVRRTAGPRGRGCGGGGAAARLATRSLPRGARHGRHSDRLPPPSGTGAARHPAGPRGGSVGLRGRRRRARAPPPPP
jgi:dienelactone hydrolase